MCKIMSENFQPVSDLTSEEGARVASDMQALMRDPVLNMPARAAVETAHDNVRARRIVAESKEKSE